MSDVKILNTKTCRQTKMAVLAAFVLFGISFSLSSCKEDKNAKGKGETGAKEVTQKDEKSLPTPTSANNKSSSGSASDTDSSLGTDNTTSTSVPLKDESSSSGAPSAADGPAPTPPLSPVKKRAVFMDKLKVALSTDPISPFTKVCEVATNTYRSVDNNNYELDYWAKEITEMYTHRRLWAEAIDNEYNNKPVLVSSNDFKIKANKFEEDAENRRIEAAEQIGKIRWGTRKADNKVDLLKNWDELVEIMPKADKIWEELTKAADDAECGK
jgi:hypothetical protein